MTHINYIPDVMSDFDCEILASTALSTHEYKVKKINITKRRSHLYRPCIFCNGYMSVIITPHYNTSELTSKSTCKKCKSKIEITTDRNNYTIVDELQ